MLVFIPAFLSGMLVPLLQSKLLPYWLLIAICAFNFAILLTVNSHLFFKVTRKAQPATIKVFKITITMIAAFFLGFAWFSLNAHSRLANQLPKKLENIPLVAEGKIDSLPVMKYGQVQFQFAIQKLCLADQCQAVHLETLLTWQHAPDNLLINQPWHLKVKLKRPHGYANPGSYDREAWLFENGIRATGYVISPMTQPAAIKIKWWMDLANIRLSYDSLIASSLTNRPFAGVIDALTVGNSSAITQQQWQVFRNTGTTHLIAISGLHIGMIAALFYLIGGWLWRRFSLLCEILPAQKAATAFAIISAFGYTAFSGFSIPAERTLIMIIVWMTSILVSRFSLSMQRFIFALGCILIINPFAVMDMGFWLSFGAIALIGYGMNARLAAESLWWRFGRVQWVATIGLMPLSWLLFQQTSIVGLLANMIAIPWVGWVTVPIALLGCVVAPINHHVAYWLWLLAEKTLEWLWPYLQYLAQLHWNSWFLSFNNPWLIIPAMVTVLLLLAPAGFPGRWLALIWFLPVITVKPAQIPLHAVKLTTLDVGQGLSVVIQTRSHTVIYDTGMGYPDGYNMGDVVLLPFLRNQHIYHLDQLIISHGDNDHAGGAPALLLQFPHLSVLTSATNKFKNYPVQACHAGQHWQWDGVEFAVIYPFIGQKLADNNNSCVLQIIAGDKRILLPGDIEKAAETALVIKYQSQLKADVILAPHHGSNSSSTTQFITAVQPQWVIFATGYLNRYRFPSSLVVKRYQQEGAQTLNVATDGAATMLLLPHQRIQVYRYREEYHHFWGSH